MTELTIMFLVCFVRASEYGVADLFVPACLWSLTKDGCQVASEGGSCTASERNESKHTLTSALLYYKRLCDGSDSCYSRFYTCW